MRLSGKYFKGLFLLCTGLGIIAFCSMCLYWQPPILTRLDNLFYDYWMVHSEVKRPHPAIAIVDVDEKSLRKEGQWPWPRTKLTRLFDDLFKAGTVSIGLDLVLSEKDRASLNWVKEQLQKEYATRLDLSGLPEKALDNDAFFTEYLKDKPCVPSEVVTRIASSGLDILKGGQRQLTIMFKDIRVLQTSLKK